MKSLETHTRRLHFFKTHPHPCSYLPDRKAITLFMDPGLRVTETIYGQLIQMGFRRSGPQVYRPYCQNCQACISIRVPCQDFKPNRNQKRCVKMNDDLRVTILPPYFSQETYELYARYIDTRHADGDMHPPTEKQFNEFLVDHKSFSTFYEFRLKDQLLAVAVVDQLSDGLSAVYTFFEPSESKRQLGSYAIIWQIKHCQALQLQYLYLGYWVKNSQKMDYKLNFKPQEHLKEGHWTNFEAI